MPSIQNAELTVATDRPMDRATVVVSCDIQFTEVEVNAMNLLGLQYTLSCQVLNKYMLDEDPVVDYDAITFPRIEGAAQRYEHVVFDTHEPMYSLHERLLGKDKLVAQLSLKNEETSETTKLRTDEIAVDLAA
jgi:hypothetical protein